MLHQTSSSRPLKDPDVSRLQFHLARGHTQKIVQLLDKLDPGILHYPCSGNEPILFRVSQVPNDNLCLSILQLLQSRNINIGLTLNEKNILWGLVAADKRKCVEYIIEKNICREVRRKNGMTLLHCACIHNSINVAKYLIAKRIGFVTDRDSEGRNAMHFAAMVGNHQIIRIMVQDFLNNTTQSFCISEVLDLLEAQDSQGRTALDLAKDFKRLKTVQYLQQCANKDCLKKKWKLVCNKENMDNIKGIQEMLTDLVSEIHTLKESESDIWEIKAYRSLQKKQKECKYGYILDKVEGFQEIFTKLREKCYGYKVHFDQDREGIKNKLISMVNEMQYEHLSQVLREVLEILDE